MFLSLRGMMPFILKIINFWKSELCINGSHFSPWICFFFNLLWLIPCHRQHQKNKCKAYIHLTIQLKYILNNVTCDHSPLKTLYNYRLSYFRMSTYRLSLHVREKSRFVIQIYSLWSSCCLVCLMLFGWIIITALRKIHWQCLQCQHGVQFIIEQFRLHLQYDEAATTQNWALQVLEDE